MHLWALDPSEEVPAAQSQSGNRCPAFSAGETMVRAYTSSWPGASPGLPSPNASQLGWTLSARASDSIVSILGCTLPLSMWLMVV